MESDGAFCPKGPLEWAGTGDPLSKHWAVASCAVLHRFLMLVLPRCVHTLKCCI